MEAAAYGAASDAKLQLTCALDVTVAGFANGWPVERDCRGGERFVSSRQRCVAKIPAAITHPATDPPQSGAPKGCQPHKSRAFDKAPLRHVLVASWVADAKLHRIMDDHLPL
jgi:hypothetical protein